MKGLITLLPVKAPRLSRAGGVALGHALDLGLRRGPAAQCLDLVAPVRGGELLDEGVLGRHDGIGHAEAGVGARREDAQAEVRTALDREVELGPFGAPDPVALHDLGPFGPLEVVEGVEELVGVPGDPEEPLLEIAFDHEITRALTGAVGQHLLVGQHRLAPRAPVHRRLGAVGQTGLPEPQEDQLGPLDVPGIVAVHLPPPVVDGTEPGQRRLELGDPGVGEDPRVRARLDGGVLGRQAEGIEADGAEDALSEHRLVANDQVTKGVVAHVPLVGGARGVGVHAQRVELLAGVVVVDLVRAVLGPVALPLELHRVDVIGACHATRVGDGLERPDQRGRECRAHGARASVVSDRVRSLRSGPPPSRGGRSRLLALTSATGGVAQLVERLTGSQEVRGFKSHRLHQILYDLHRVSGAVRPGSGTPHSPRVSGSQ